MTNHVHLVITPMAENAISQMMQALGRRYVRYINKTYKRTGTLWEGRYKSSLIHSEQYLLTCMRYIELSPLRARMVNHTGEYQWSSYASNAQGEPHPIYLQLGTSPSDRVVNYRELFRHHIEGGLLHDIRESLNHELVLGNSYFREKVEEMTKRRVSLGKPGRPRVKEESAVYII